MATVERHEGERREGRSTARIAAWVASVAAWIFFSIQVTPGESVAYQLGEVIGAMAVTLAVAAALRGIYWLIRGRRVAFWSPWLFVVAAVIGLLVRLGQLSDESSAVALSVLV
jgi:hypothetical protein